MARWVYVRLHYSFLLWASLGGSDSKESACNTGDQGSIPGLKRSPGGKECLPTPVFWPGECHRWRILVGYSPWAHKESDTTERLTLSFSYYSSLYQDCVHISLAHCFARRCRWTWDGSLSLPSHLPQVCQYRRRLCLPALRGLLGRWNPLSG